MQSLYDSACALVPPSPPAPPSPPKIAYPDPKPPPPPPPPTPNFQQRLKEEEADSDPDCTMVSYNTCRGVVADYAAEFGTANVLRVSFAPCEGTDVETGCFQGCSYGGQNGGHFHALLPDMDAEFNRTNPKRCKLANLPYCACANTDENYARFSPPPPTTFALRAALPQA